MSNENIAFKDQLLKQKEALLYKRKEKTTLESDLEDIKKKFSANKKSKIIKETKNEIEKKDQEIKQLKEIIDKKEQEYAELRATVDKIKNIKTDYNSLVKK